MSTEPPIQKTHPEDQSSVEQLLSDCELPSEDLTENHLDHFFQVKKAGEIVAVAGLEIYGSNGLLRSVAVQKAHRGKGLAERLTRHIEGHARSENVKRLYLLTTTADTYFKKLGYSSVDRDDLPMEIKESSQFKDICPSSALTMGKSL